MACVLQQLCEANDAKEPQGRTDIKGVQSRFSAASLPVISIYDYLVRIFTYAECSPACFILALIYIDRVIIKGGQGLTVNSKTIHRLLVTSIMVAAKFIDDVYLSNAHFARMGGIGNKELNKLELDFLFYIEFSLLVPITTYQQYRNEIGRHASLHVNRTPPTKGQRSACSLPQTAPSSEVDCDLSSSSSPSHTSSPSHFCPSTSSASVGVSSSCLTVPPSPFSSTPLSSLERDSPITPIIDSSPSTPSSLSSNESLMKRISSSPCLASNNNLPTTPLSRAISSPCLSNLPKGQLLRNQQTSITSPTFLSYCHSPCKGKQMCRLEYSRGLILSKSFRDPMSSTRILSAKKELFQDNHFKNNHSTTKEEGGISQISSNIPSSSSSSQNKNKKDDESLTVEQFQVLETTFPVPSALMDVPVHSAKMNSSPSPCSSASTRADLDLLPQKHSQNSHNLARRRSSPLSTEVSKKERSPKVPSPTSDSPTSKGSWPPQYQRLLHKSELSSYSSHRPVYSWRRKDQKRKGSSEVVLLVSDDKKPQNPQLVMNNSTNDELFIQIPIKFNDVALGLDQGLPSVVPSSFENEGSGSSVSDVEMMENSEKMDTGSEVRTVSSRDVENNNGTEQVKLSRCSSGGKISRSRLRRKSSSNNSGEDESSFGPVRRRSFSRSSPTTRNPNVVRRMSASTASMRHFRFGEYERRTSASTPTTTTLRRPSLNGPAQ